LTYCLRVAKRAVLRERGEHNEETKPKGAPGAEVGNGDRATDPTKEENREVAVRMEGNFPFWLNDGAVRRLVNFRSA
jgi:hypothetical protein